MTFNKIKEKLIRARLNRALARTVEIKCHDKIIIFSDHHKGICDRADDFAQCLTTYRAALEYYKNKDYTLIILGDSEELWENKIEDVLKTNKHILRFEAAFYKKNQYYRCYGNHDKQWKSSRKVKKYLHPLFPGLTVPESFLLTINNKKFFLTHGHQGELLSDIFSPFSKFIVKVVWRPFQAITGKKLSSLSSDLQKVKWHDNIFYKWIEEKENLILISGHTHRPIWLSQNKEEQINKYVKRKPIYFNTGCCSFKDGDITGIEISNGKMELVKFHNLSKDKVVLAAQELNLL
jgi:predicted phosphodiesterase